jgi:hypothetical protein
MFKRGSRVVFAFSDAAGANACLAQAFIVQQENQCRVACFSNKQPSSLHWQQAVSLKEKLAERDLEGAEILFSGTSHPTTSNYFELDAIRLAKSKNIYTVAFVDHWTNIRMRFDLAGEMVYPDEIWLLDEHAKSIAIKEDLPASLLWIHKNPYLVYLSAHWKSAYPQGGYIKKLNLLSQRKVIVIAPDPITPRIKDFDPGFTEHSAVQDLLHVIYQSEIKNHITILIKAHPLQPKETLGPVLEKYSALGLDLKLITESDNPELINIAYLVIGFYSNFLLEAHAMNKPVIRYYPGNPQIDPLRHLTSLPPISNPSQALLTLHSLRKN